MICAFTAKVNPEKEFTEQLRQLSEHFPAQASSILVQAFCANVPLPQVENFRKAFRQCFPLAELIGTSAYSWYGADEVGISEILLHFSFFQKTQVSVHSWSAAEFSHTAVEPVITMTNARLAILFASPFHFSVEDFLDHVHYLNPKLNLAGGLSSDHWRFSETYQFCAQQVVTDGVVLALLKSQSLFVRQESVFGWQAFGRKLRIDHAEGSRLYLIDGMTPKQMYSKYLGAEICEQLLTSSVDYPLLLNRSGMEVARAPMRFHSDGSMTFAGNFRVGECAQIAFGDIHQITEKASSRLGALPLNKAEVAYIYSCAGRHHFLQDEMDIELQRFKGVHSAGGFMSYGEFVGSERGKHLLNHTLTALLLSETEEAIEHESYIEALDMPINMQKAGFSNLIRTASLELNDLNSNLERQVQERTKEYYAELNLNRITQLPSRHRFLEDVQDQRFNCQNVAILDIRNFANYNDLYSLEVGDQLLVKVGNYLKSCLEGLPKHAARLYHFSGDEFALVVNDRVDRQRFVWFVETLVMTLKDTPMNVLDQEFYIELAVGISAVRPTTILEMLSQADRALKQAKLAHVEVVSYSESLSVVKELQHNQQQTQALLAAVKNELLRVVLQPIQKSREPVVSHYECLIRMLDDQGELISPYHFLDVAKKARLYHHITLFVLNEAEKLILQTGKTFSVNVSHLDFEHRAVQSRLSRLLTSRYVASRLIFEVVESESLEAYDRVKNFAEMATLAGASIAVDDFGSGFSNYEHLARFPVEHLKIDGSLIRSLCNDRKMLLVVRSIVNFAHAIGAKVTAEFVENEQLAQVCRELRIDLLQGYYIGMPQLAEHLFTESELQQDKAINPRH